MPLRAIDVAHSLAEACQQQYGKGPLPAVLNLLTYLAHGWHLALHDAPLLDESPVATPHGPMVPSVHHALEGLFGAIVTVPGAQSNVASAQEQALIEQVIRSYGHCSPQALASCVQGEGTPWAVVRDLVPDRVCVIPDTQITDHIRRMLYDAGVMPHSPPLATPPPSPRVSKPSTARVLPFRRR